MGMMEEIGERVGVGTGWVVGASLAAVALAGPSIVKVLRPAAKTAIKGYMAARDRAKEAMAESSERLQDLYEEAQHEYKEEHIEGEHEHREMKPTEEAPARTAAARRHRAVEGEA